MRQETELRPYQQRIATHLYESDEALCVVRPGGGKTVSALTAFKELKDQAVLRHALVIAPKRVARSVWPDEINAWAHTHGLTYTLVTGTPAERKLKLSLRGDITIVGIDVVEWLLGELEGLPPDHPLFDLLIIDEISKLRSPTGVRAKLLAKAAPRWRMIWGLSGTLRPNSAQDLFMPVRVVTRGKLWGRSFYQWRKERFYPADYHGYNWLPFPGAEDKINAEMRKLTVTMRDDEAPQLPELSVILDRIELPPAAKKTYRTMQDKLFASFGKDSIVAANAAVATGKLAQIANGFMYDTDSVRTLGHVDYGSKEPLVMSIHDEKRAWLQDLVDDAASPMLLIYEFREDLQMMREVCGIDLPCLGPDASDADSAARIKAWNASQLPFLALHPASGGHGLNLQAGGSDMAWIAPTWSPELWEQTIARLHRSGQGKPVIVRVCVATGTVDEMKLHRVHDKMDAQAAFERYLAACNVAE